MSDSRSLVEDDGLVLPLGPTETVGLLLVGIGLGVLAGRGVVYGAQVGVLAAGLTALAPTFAYYARTFRASLATFHRDTRATHRAAQLKAGAGAAGVATFAATVVGNHNLVYLVKNFGLGGVFAQLFLSLIGFIRGAGQSILGPLGAFADGLSRVVAAVFPARIINAAADFTAFSITQGRWNFFGPLTFAVGIASVLVGLYLFLVVARRINFSPISVLYGQR